MAEDPFSFLEENQEDERDDVVQTTDPFDFLTEDEQPDIGVVDAEPAQVDDSFDFLDDPPEDISDGPAQAEDVFAFLGEKDTVSEQLGDNQPKYFNTQYGRVLLPGSPEPDGGLVKQATHLAAARLSATPLDMGAGVMQSLADAGEISGNAIGDIMGRAQLARYANSGEYLPASVKEQIYNKYQPNMEDIDKLRDVADTWRTAANGIAGDYGVTEEFANSFMGQIAAGVGGLPAYMTAALGGPAGYVALFGSGYEEATGDYIRLVKEQGLEYNAADNFVYAAPYAVASSILEKIGVEATVGKLFKNQLKSTGAELAKRISSGTFGEGLTEASQGLVQDFMASMTVDEGRGVFTAESFKQRLNEFLVGAIIGGGVSTTVSLSDPSVRNRGPKDQKELNDILRSVSPEDIDLIPNEELRQRRIDQLEDENRQVVNPMGKKVGPKLKFSKWSNMGGPIDLDKNGKPIALYQVEGVVPELGVANSSERGLEMRKELGLAEEESAVGTDVSRTSIEKNAKANDMQVVLESPPIEALQERDRLLREKDFKDNREQRLKEMVEESAPVDETQREILELDAEAMNPNRTDPLGTDEDLQAVDEEVELEYMPQILPRGEQAEARRQLDEIQRADKRSRAVQLAEAKAQAEMQTILDQVTEEANKTYRADDEFENEQISQEEQDLIDYEVRDQTRKILRRIGKGSKFTVPRQPGPTKAELVKKAREARKLRKERLRSGKKIRLLSERLAETKQQIKNLMYDQETQIREVKTRAEAKIEAYRARTRERIAAVARSKQIALEAKIQERKDLDQSMFDLQKLVDSLPVTIRGKFRLFPKMAKGRSPEAREPTLALAHKRVAKLLDEFTFKTNRDAFRKMIDRVTKNKRRPEELHHLDEVKRIAETPIADVDARRDVLNTKKEQLTEEEQNELVLLSMFGGILAEKVADTKAEGFTGETMRRARTELEYMIRTGRSSVAERIKRDKQETAEKQNRVIESMLPGQKLKRLGTLDAEELKRKRNVFRNALRRVDDWANTKHYGLEHLLDMMSREGKRYDTYLHRLFMIPVFNATGRVQTRNRESMTRFRDKLIDTLLKSDAVQSTKDRKRVTQAVTRMSQEWAEPTKGHGITWIEDGAMDESPLSVWQGITMYMQWRQPGLEKTFEKMGITEDTMRKVDEFIGQEGMIMADWLMSEYKQTGMEVAATVRKVDHYVPEMVNNYSPITRIKDSTSEDSMDATDMNGYRQVSEKGMFLRERVNNTHPLLFKPASEVFANYMYQMNHYVEFAQIGKDYRTVFGNQRVRRGVRQLTGGNEYMQSVDKMFGNILRGGIDKAKINQSVQNLVNKITVGSLALRIPVFFKQIGSFPGYAAEMPVKEYLRYQTRFFSDWKNIRKNIDTIRQTEFMKNRMSNSFDRELAEIAKRSHEQALAGIRTKKDKMMFMTRLGDAGAIIIGGWPLYQYTYDQTLASELKKGTDPAKAEQRAKEEAELKFSMVTSRQQQDSNLFSLGSWQTEGSWAKMFTMYMTTPIQYHRNMATAIKAWHQRDEKGERRLDNKTMLKQVAMFHIVLPSIYTAIGSGFYGMWGDDDEAVKEFWTRQGLAGLRGNVGALMLWGQAIDTLIDVFGTELFLDKEEAFKLSVGSPALDEISDFTLALFETATADNWEDRLEESIPMIKSAGVAGLGLPMKSLEDLVKFIMEVKEDEFDATSLPNLGGWSDYAIPGEQK